MRMRWWARTNARHSAIHTANYKNFQEHHRQKKFQAISSISRTNLKCQEISGVSRSSRTCRHPVRSLQRQQVCFTTLIIYLYEELAAECIAAHEKVLLHYHYLLTQLLQHSSNSRFPHGPQTLPLVCCYPPVSQSRKYSFISSIMKL